MCSYHIEANSLYQLGMNNGFQLPTFGILEYFPKRECSIINKGMTLTGEVYSVEKHGVHHVGQIGQCYTSGRATSLKKARGRTLARARHFVAQK